MVVHKYSIDSSAKICDELHNYRQFHKTLAISFRMNDARLSIQTENTIRRTSSLIGYKCNPIATKILEWLYGIWSFVRMNRYNPDPITWHWGVFYIIYSNLFSDSSQKMYRTDDSNLLRCINGIITYVIDTCDLDHIMACR